MSEPRKINASQLKKYASELKSGDKILLTGTVYTSRDAAHKRIKALIENGQKLPFELENAVIYYAGPTPAPKGKPIGSCGPTTSGRMDKFAPLLLDLGLGGMIGKGERSKEVRDAVVRNGSVYLCAVGGAGALAAHCIKKCEVIAFEDLGCESVKKLYVENFPLLSPAAGLYWQRVQSGAQDPAEEPLWVLGLQEWRCRPCGFRIKIPWSVSAGTIPPAPVWNWCGWMMPKRHSPVRSARYSVWMIPVPSSCAGTTAAA